MKNFVREGSTMPIVAPTGGLVSGQAVLVGDLVGVAAVDAAEGAELEAHIEGVYTLPKLSTDVIAQGAVVFWDDTAGNFTTTELNNTRAGVAFRAAGNGASLLEVKLTPGAGAVVQAA